MEQFPVILVSINYRSYQDKLLSFLLYFRYNVNEPAELNRKSLNSLVNISDG